MPHRFFVLLALSYAVTVPAISRAGGVGCPVGTHKSQTEVVQMTVPDADATGLTTAGITLTNQNDFRITDVVVAIDMSHTFIGDLSINLIRSGSVNATVKLMSGSACPDDFVGGTDYHFRTGGGTDLLGNCDFYIDLDVPPGCYESREDLGLYNDTEKNGDLWQLQIVDQGPADIGFLESWTLFLRCESAVPVEDASWGKVKGQYR